jgi:two-component system chemotaxis response regulator CheB
MPGKRGVLIVDDSATVRATLTELLNSDERLEVVAVAGDPYIAAAKIEKRVPDVIVLDLEMPRMDGLTFLKRLMAQHPIPVVICSSAAEKGSAKAFEALEAGAIEVIAKPRIGTKQFLEETRATLCDTVVAASLANMRQKRQTMVPPKLTADVILPKSAPRRATLREAPAGRSGKPPALIAIGASTGGTEALLILLRELTRETAGIVIVQHMPEGFTAAFADRLNQLCEIEIREAKDGDTIEPGLALVAPGNWHMLVRGKGKGYAVEVKAGPQVCRHRPSVDVLFRSVAQSVGPNALGVILTGMGDDGAEGMLEMKQAGAFNLAQDEASCVVFGMPNQAIKRGGVDRTLPLNAIAPLLMKISSEGMPGAGTRHKMEAAPLLVG